jgi:ATP-dependent Lhr-like helicase
MSNIYFATARKNEEIEKSLDPLIREWFFSKYKDFSLTQKYGVMSVWERKNILISAPTGGTKTLTAFLSVLNYLVGLARKEELENKVYAIYCSPLKALSNDIYFNLTLPLEEIRALAEKKGIKLQKIEVGLRTGDTDTKEKNRMLKKAPHILVTTPESMAIMINSPKFSEYLKAIEFAIVDEIHSLAENKRGVHLSLTMERLQELSAIEFVRIGLSATVSPLEKVAKFLVGSERDCFIAEVNLEKKIELEVISPVEDFLETNTLELNHKIYTLLDKYIQENKTTLIFTNTRAATERVVHNLKEKFPGNYIENIGAHHSSLSREHRQDIEQRLREGKLKVVVCSTSLELGIDIGFIDLVILLGSPKSVSRAIQRIGRAGHKLHDTARGKFIVSDFDDLVECSIILKNSKEKIIDEIHIPENCLDVLSQQIYGMCIASPWKVSEALKLIRKSYCYRNLTRDDFFAVISYLSGEYELNLHNVYSKIWYDAGKDEMGKLGKLARVIYMTNIGTIPDESFASVVSRTGGEIGKIDELFLEKMKKGDVFVLGGKKYQFLYCKGMKVYVMPSERSPTIPSWFSEMLPLSFTSAMSIGRFRRLVSEKFEAKKSPDEIKEFIKDYCYVSLEVAKTLYEYFKKQFDYSIIPNDKKILIEEFKGEKKYILFHTLFGRRVNDVLSRALAFVVASARKRDVEVGISDNGFYIAGKDIEVEKLERGLKMLSKENLRQVLEEAIDKTETLKRRFRHCAARGLMILRNYKGRIKSVGKQQMSSHFIIAAVEKRTKDFPLLKEAKREVLEDLMDIENATEGINKLNRSEIKIVKKNTAVVSPFAINLILQGHSDLIKVEDKTTFIKRVYAELENAKNENRKF